MNEKDEKDSQVKSVFKPLLLYFDLEAAQSSVFTGDIVEIAARCEPEIRDAAFESLINSTQELNSFSIERCGISASDLEGQQKFPDVFKRFIKWIQKLVRKVNQKTGDKYFPVLCAHGGHEFDFRMLLSNMKRYKIDQNVLKQTNLHFADTFEFCKNLQAQSIKELNETKLSMDSLYSKFCPGKPFINRHRAMGDVNALVQIFGTEPLKTAVKKIDYVTSDLLISSFKTRCCEKEQKLLLEEKMGKLDAYTKTVNLKKLVQIQLTYDGIQRIFEHCCSFMDFYEAMKDHGIDRKTAKFFACQFGGLGLKNQGTEPYSNSNPTVVMDDGIDFSVNEADIIAKETMATKKPANVHPLPESSFQVTDISECWENDLDESRSFRLTITKPEAAFSLTIDDFVSNTPSKQPMKNNTQSKINCDTSNQSGEQDTLMVRKNSFASSGKISKVSRREIAKKPDNNSLNGGTKKLFPPEKKTKEAFRKSKLSIDDDLKKSATSLELGKFSNKKQLCEQEKELFKRVGEVSRKHSNNSDNVLGQEQEEKTNEMVKEDSVDKEALKHDPENPRKWKSSSGILQSDSETVPRQDQKELVNGKIFEKSSEGKEILKIYTKKPGEFLLGKSQSVSEKVSSRKQDRKKGNNKNIKEVFEGKESLKIDHKDTETSRCISEREKGLRQEQVETTNKTVKEVSKKKDAPENVSKNSPITRFSKNTEMSQNSSEKQGFKKVKSQNTFGKEDPEKDELLKTDLKNSRNLELRRVKEKPNDLISFQKKSNQHTNGKQMKAPRKFFGKTMRTNPKSRNIKNLDRSANQQSSSSGNLGTKYDVSDTSNKEVLLQEKPLASDLKHSTGKVMTGNKSLQSVEIGETSKNTIQYATKRSRNTTSSQNQHVLYSSSDEVKQNSDNQNVGGEKLMKKKIVMYPAQKQDSTSNDKSVSEKKQVSNSGVKTSDARKHCSNQDLVNIVSHHQPKKASEGTTKKIPAETQIQRSQPSANSKKKREKKDRQGGSKLCHQSEAVVFLRKSRERKMRDWPRDEIFIGDIPIYVPVKPTMTGKKDGSDAEKNGNVEKMSNKNEQFESESFHESNKRNGFNVQECEQSTNDDLEVSVNNRNSCAVGDISSCEAVGVDPPPRNRPGKTEQDFDGGKETNVQIQETSLNDVQVQTTLSQSNIHVGSSEGENGVNNVLQQDLKYKNGVASSVVEFLSASSSATDCIKEATPSSQESSKHVVRHKETTMRVMVKKIDNSQQTDCAFYTTFNPEACKEISSDTHASFEDKGTITIQSDLLTHSSKLVGSSPPSSPDAQQYLHPCSHQYNKHSPQIRNSNEYESPVFEFPVSPHQEHLEENVLYGIETHELDSPGRIFDISMSSEKRFRKGPMSSEKNYPYQEKNSLYQGNDLLYRGNDPLYLRNDSLYYTDGAMPSPDYPNGEYSFTRNGNYYQPPNRPNLYLDASSNMNVMPQRFLTPPCSPLPSFYPSSLTQGPPLLQRYPSQFVPRFRGTSNFVPSRYLGPLKF